MRVECARANPDLPPPPLAPAPQYPAQGVLRIMLCVAWGTVHQAMCGVGDCIVLCVAWGTASCCVWRGVLYIMLRVECARPGTAQQHSAGVREGDGATPGAWMQPVISARRARAGPAADVL